VNATPDTRRWPDRAWVQAALVLALGLAVYLPALGVRPLDNSEGHRVLPGWTMLRTGDWLKMEMFEQGYLRKPPGMSWAVAGTSSLLGETVLAARLPSALAAIALGLATWWFVRRWLGGRWGVPAAAACLLMPQMWAPGRSAEIEMLNTFGTGLMALGLLDLVLRRPGAGTLTGLLAGALGAGGIVVCAAAKGPASATVLLGVLTVVSAIIARGLAPAGAGVRVLASVVLGIASTAALAAAVLLANAGPDVIREDVAGAFLWTPGRLMGVALLLPLAALSAAPISLALGFPWLGRSRRLIAPDDRAVLVGAVCGGAWLVSVGLLVLAGVSNPRYALPAAVLIPPVAAALLAHLSRAGTHRAPATLIGAALVIGALVNIALAARPTFDQRAGPEAARTLALGLTPGRPAIVWADDAIEARPDVLDLLAKNATGGPVRIVWAKHRMLRAELPENTRGDAYMLLRTDAGSPETARFAASIESGRLREVARAGIRGWSFALYRRN
jgi:4-amino-4-deoxy-L-arabinose transferase-like glycosyltransferase